jgi:hypothetical protein
MWKLMAENGEKWQSWQARELAGQKSDPSVLSRSALEMALLAHSGKRYSCLGSLTWKYGRQNSRFNWTLRDPPAPDCRIIRAD